MTIESLEQQLCEDCISRKEVNVLVDELARAISDERCFISRGRSTATILQDILDLPSVTPQPCEDCISRADVLDLAKKGVLISNSNYQSVCKAINELPPVTPKYTDEEIDRAQAVEQAYIDKMVELAVEEFKRPKGKWISHREHCENLGVMPNGLGAYQWCSNCDCAIDIREWQRNHYNFCPNCGADMRESED